MKSITIVRQLHEGMQARVQDSGESSESFSASNGVKQGCVLAPTLFSLIFSAILTDAWTSESASDGVLTAPSSTSDDCKAKAKVQSDTINDLLFADDCALNAISEANMQYSVGRFSDACDNLGLTISTKKTLVMHQPAPGKPYVEPNITLNDQRLMVVEKFTYLGSTLSRNVVIDDE